MSELAKGFRRGRFFDLSDRDKRDIITLMARVAEQAGDVSIDHHKN